MSPEEEALVRLVRALHEAIPYMLTGSVASSYHGRPRSEKQISDAVGVLEVNPKLDRAYIERWARELGIMDLWQEIAAHAPPET